MLSKCQCLVKAELLRHRASQVALVEKNLPAKAEGGRCRLDLRVQKTPGESHRQRSLAGSSPWGRKESNTIEVNDHVHSL